ncbi:hypothetical protein F8388_021302 [Cannabis sativa]|uniref:Rhodanese domain-containing protein n=1 Tax=Cannabis sativa TaxID=3483 RepID=A0A7J6GFJ6_CANSA|nr:hypothetical protein F8388_021302 [Cannabis sativa]
MAAAKNAQDVVTIDVYTAKGLLSIGHRYLDVRTVEEFNKSHVEGALNVPYMFITQEGKVKNPEFLSQASAVCKKDDHLVVGCNSGGRSLRACVELLNDGYENVNNMEGGYSKWFIWIPRSYNKSAHHVASWAADFNFTGLVPLREDSDRIADQHCCQFLQSKLSINQLHKDIECPDN